MPRCLPPDPAFTTTSERAVWERLRDQLRDEDVLIANLRVTDQRKDHELDLVVLLPGAGAVVLEVKGGQVWKDSSGWHQSGQPEPRDIHPVDQARDGKYALRTYVEQDPRWRDTSRARVRWGHAVVLPYTRLDDDFATPDCPRWSVVDATQLDDVAGLVYDIPDLQESGCRRPDVDDVDLIAEILAGRGRSLPVLLGEAAERDAQVQRLTQQQSMILDATRLLTRVEVRGGAGSGKTFLALAKARRLTKAGQRVALICYSHGLASYLRRQVDGWKRRERPAYVGEYHSLGMKWGAPEGPPENDRSQSALQFWEHDLPAQMVQLAAQLPDGHRFDAIVIDEAQDFADKWWSALLAALRDEESGGVYAFTDEAQAVFTRFGRPPLQLVPIVLDHNLRNTRPIGEVFNPLTEMRMRLLGGEGPAVTFVECSADDALDAANDQVDDLLDQGWRPQDVALLTTGSRHPEQAYRQENGAAAYWESFWDDDQVFYGHVLGFKGLERQAVVLALNEDAPRERSRERLYVGLSRARDQLVVCGDPAFVAQVGGDQVLRRLRGTG